jgi:hypothetical protein
LSNIFPEVDLSRFDPQTKVSRRHARIWRDGESLTPEQSRFDRLIRGPRLTLEPAPVAEHAPGALQMLERMPGAEKPGNGWMPRGPKGEKRPADVIGAAPRVVA